MGKLSNLIHVGSCHGKKERTLFLKCQFFRIFLAILLPVRFSVIFYYLWLMLLLLENLLSYSL